MALAKLKASISDAFNRTYPFTMEKCKAEQPDGTMKPIVFHVLPATLDNQAFRNEVLVLSMAAKPDAPEAVTTESITKSEDRDIDVFARHVVRGWDNVYDDNGQPVPYSVESAIELLNIVRSEFYKLRSFATDPRSFDPIDVEELTKK